MSKAELGWPHGMLCLILLGAVAACSSAPPATPLASPESGATTAASDTAVLETPMPSPSAAQVEVVSPTPDLRIPPEQWQQWPVVPTVSARARQIYAEGLAMGNDASHFSKVGDCQNITEAFMGIYDLPGRYTLPEDGAHLQSTIDAFAGSFGREGMAVKGGFNVASVLSPMWADPDVCQPGETPLECELRVHRPTIVFISMEVWYEGRTAETYAGYLRQIVDTAIERGAVPVLATKADNVEGDHSINLATATVAYEYDVPLWNFWLGVQPLPDHGIDWARDSDGFHLTVDAWNVRSYTALQVLDALRAALAPSG
ncbi:MAG TPA: hypothetical protein VFI11_01040 [Anaerolineales bacterium]|nr:hypothetical protein [Anaerolineales bacterium]